jgi:hypothetical protein
MDTVLDLQNLPIEADVEPGHAATDVPASNLSLLLCDGLN